MKKVTVIALCAMLFAFCSSVEAQQPTKVPRIGYLNAVAPSTVSDRIRRFVRDCGNLGTWRGKTLSLSTRYAEGKLDRLPALANELVRLKVNVIVTSGPLATRVTKQATTTIPIVMAQDADPVGNGFVASLARPGGNITGLSALAPGAKRKTAGAFEGDRSQALPRGRPRDIDPAGQCTMLKETELAAGAFRVKLQYLDILVPKDIESAFRAAGKGRADAILMMVPEPRPPVLTENRL